MRVYASAEMTLTDTNDGISVTGIDRYYMASSSSSGITVDSNGWKPDPQETNPISRYHWSYEVVNYSSGAPVPTKPAVIGVYGDSAKMLYLSATAESMTFDADGTPNPSSQVITLTANLQNISGNASFVATAYNGSTVVSDVVLSGVGNTRTFNQAQFPASANRIQVRATLGNLVDTVTIVKLTNGSKGQNAVVGLLTNESITLPANKDGVVPASSFTGAKGTFDVYDGITKKTGSGVAYSVVSQSNITVAINATTGVYSVTAMPTGTTVLNGHATLRAVYNGVTIEKQINVSKSIAGATGSTGATGAQGASATSYWITASNNIIGKSQTGVINPTTITFKGFSKTGTANSVAYSGMFIIQTSTNGTDYATRYASKTNENSYTYTIPTDSLFVKCLFYMAGGTSVLLDEQTVPIVESAEGIQVGGVNLFYIALGDDGKVKTLQLQPNTSYIVSTDIPTRPDGGRHIFFGNVGFVENSAINGVSIDKKLLLETDSTGVLEIKFSQWDNSFLRSGGYHIKLEKGTVATDWTPAPEDARTYKAWANSADGGEDFTRVYPNKNIFPKENVVRNDSMTGWGLIISDSPIDVQEGMAYTSSVYYEDVAVHQVGVRMYWMNSSGSTISESPTGNYIQVGQSGYSEITAVAPVGAVSMQVGLRYATAQTTSGTATWKNMKVEEYSSRTIYTTNPELSLSGSVPKYVGFSPIDSDVPHEYEWIMNPEYAQALADEALAGKVDNDAEYENLKNMAQEVKESYENFVSEGGEYKTEHNKLLERTTAVETNLGEYKQQINFIDTYMSAGNEGLIMGVKDSEGKPDANAMQMLLSNKSLSFMDGGEVVAYFSGQSFYINRGAIVESLQVGQHKITNLGNGHTVFQFTG